MNYSHNNKANQTKAEKILWYHLRNRRLKGYKFRRQYPINNYILDFYCVDKKLAVELDGSQHMESNYYDNIRSDELKRLSIKVIRSWDNEIFKNINTVLEQIITAIEEVNS